MRRIPNTYSLKAEVLERAGRDASVLVMGSSHELNGIRPVELHAQAINLANGSQSLELDARLSLHAAQRMPELKLVIFGISYFSFASRLNASTESWREPFYMHYFGVHEAQKFVRLPQLSDYSVAALFDPGQMLLAARTPLAGSVTDRGWLLANDPNGARALNDDSAAAARVRVHESARNTARDVEVDETRRAETVALLRNVIATLESRNIAVVFASAPLSEAYRRHLDPKTLTLNSSDLEHTRGGRPFYDYSADNRFGSADFANLDHLNAAGASKFTRIIDDDIISNALTAGARSAR